MEFEWGTDMDLAGLDVREKLDVLFLPLDVKKPLVLRFNPNLDPVVRLALNRTDLTTPLSNPQLVALRTFADEELRRNWNPCRCRCSQARRRFDAGNPGAD